MATEMCPWCVENSGRISATRPCCQLREIANAPPFVRTAAFHRMNADSGRDAAIALIAQVNEERRRLYDLRLEKLENDKKSARAALGLKS